MIRALCVFLFLWFAGVVFSQNQSQSMSIQEQKVVLICVLISKYDLFQDEFCKNYKSKNLNPLLRMSRCSRPYYALCKEDESIEIDDVYNSYKAYCSTEDVFALIKVANASNKKVKTLPSMQKVFVGSLDQINYVTDKLESFSRPSAPVLELKEEFSFGTQIKVNVISPEAQAERLQALIELKQDNDEPEEKEEPEEKPGLRVNGNSRYHIDMMKTCLNQLMYDYRIPENIIEIKIIPDKEKSPESITPLELYMRLLNNGEETKYHYIGDFSPSGKLRSWGYIKDHLQRTEHLQKSLAFIDIRDFDDLKDMVCLLGVEPILNMQFVGAKYLKPLVAIERKGINESWFGDFKILADKIQNKKIAKSYALKLLNEIISDCPEHLSALIYRDYLLGKLAKELSLRNTYFEFETYYSRMRQIGINGFLTKEELKKIGLDPKYPSSKLMENSKAINGIVGDLKKLSNVANRYFKKPCENLIAAYLLIDQMNNKRITSKSQWTSIYKKYFATLREINLSRDLFIDSQKALDGVFR